MGSHERRAPVLEKKEEKRGMYGSLGGRCFIFSSHHFLIHIFLHMSGGKGVSVCLVHICMYETILFIHGVNTAPIHWRMGDPVHIIVMDSLYLQAFRFV